MHPNDHTSLLNSEKLLATSGDAYIYYSFFKSFYPRSIILTISYFSYPYSTIKLEGLIF